MNGSCRVRACDPGLVVPLCSRLEGWEVLGPGADVEGAAWLLDFPGPDTARIVRPDGSEAIWSWEALPGALPWCSQELTASRQVRHAAQVLQALSLDPERIGRPVPLLPPPAVPPGQGSVCRFLSRVRSRGANWGVGSLEGSPLRDGCAAWKPLLQERGTTLADPFGLVWQGRQWLFFEEQNPGCPGKLSVLDLADHGIHHDILPSPNHRSWPNVFVLDGQPHMVPETSEDGCIGLWRCTRFPDRWERVCELLPGRWADPVLWRQDERWYLFASPVGSHAGDHSDTLMLFCSDHLGDFRPHPLNPLRTSVVGARPAGRLFQRDGRLFRPAQDCRDRYGRAVLVFEVDRLTPTDYQEHLVARLEPPPGGHGLHTLNVEDGVTWIDVLARHWACPQM